MPYDALSWVCKYPNDVAASAWGASGALSFSDWSQADGDYYPSLSTAGKTSSCALQGPCYPVLTSQANVWQTCQTQKLTNLPLSTTAVNGLTTCISCCNSATAYTDASCSVLDADGMNIMFQWPQHANSTGPYASANDRIGCLQSCQSLHGSIESFADDTEGSVHPIALGLFQAKCAAVGATAAAVPAPATADGGAMAAVLNSIAASYKATALRYVGDMMLAWRALVVCGLFLPFILSFFWLAAIRYSVKPLVYMTVLCVDLATAGVTLYCFSKSGAIGGNSFSGIVSYSDKGGFSFNATAASQASTQLTTTPSDGDVMPVGISDISSISKRQMYYLGIASAILTIVTWGFTIFLLPRLKLAIAVIRVACDSLNKVPSLIWFPFAGALAISGFMVWWVAVGIFVYSSGELKKRDCCASVQEAFAELYPGYVGPAPSCDDIHCGYEMVMNNKLRNALIYHGFEFLWTTQFIIAFSILTVSQVVHKCYLAAGGSGVQLTAWPLALAIHNTTRYYLGSCALGSLVVASVQFFRYVVMYLMQRLKKVVENNTFVRVLMWIVNFVLWLLQKIVELISHNAYVMIAINGTGFCSSAATATSLMTTNFVRFATLTAVADSMLFLGKLGTAATSAFFTFVYLDKNYKSELTSPIIPVIVVFLTAFAIASIAFGVVEQAVNATMLAKCNDEDQQHPDSWAPPELKEAQTLAKQHDDEVAAKAKSGRGCCSAPAADNHA